MAQFRPLLLVMSLLWCSTESPAFAERWPQFRGEGGSATSVSTQVYPVQIAPDRHVLWKTHVPAGHSSPILDDNRVYLTAAQSDPARLTTVALDRATGALVWEREAPFDQLEAIHKTGSYAQSTPVTDGQIVVSFFGSSGLHAYTRDGEPLWSKRMGPFRNDFGSGSSPILVDDLAVLVQDHDVGSFIAAYDKRTGAERWRTDRSEFLRNFSSPVLWNVGGELQIVVAATLRIVGYDLKTGQELWTVRGVSRIVNTTPAIGPDNTLYAACFSPGGEGEDRVEPMPVDELFQHDEDANGTIEEAEFPDSPLRRRFTQLDRDKDSHLSREEYLAVSRAHAEGKNVALAIRPGGRGDITATHVAWTQPKQVPYCSSPLYLNNSVLMIKNGGIFTVMDASRGKVTKLLRLSSTDEYYASPVTAGGLVYLLSQRGELTVLDSAQDWAEVHTANFQADGHATPALADGKIYLRAGDKLYCFGDDEAVAETNP